MITIDHVSKHYGRVRAVVDVSAQIPTGVVTGLLGPNGAGKSTLIRMITTLLAPSAGSVSVCGHDTVLEASRARACIGYLPESAPLYPEMSVIGYLRYRASLMGLARGERAPAVGSAIERCWLGDMTQRRIGTLSKGYRQRVGLASAILHDPRVIVLDEPTTGLDPEQILAMRELIAELARGRVVLLSSHILSEVQASCDRLMVIASGSLRAHGTPAELIAALGTTSAYVLEVVAPRPDAGFEAHARAVLSGVLGVREVTCESVIEPPGSPAAARLRVTPHAGAPDLREELARACAGAGLLVRDLTRTRPTLEEVFLRATRRDGPAQEAAA